MTMKEFPAEAKPFIDNNQKPIEYFTKEAKQENVLQTKVYRKRWLILLIFFLFTFGNKCQYLQYTMILNVVTKYYDVSTLAVKGTAMVYNLSTPIMIYPCTLIINYWGLRWTMILASVTTSLGTWIKYLAVSPERYLMTMIGQTLVGSWQVFVISLPGGLAARWFGPTEVATATALGYVGMKIGMATLSLIMPLIVRMHENVDDIGEDMKTMLLPQAIYCSFVALGVVAFFEDEPKLPPSKSRALQKLNKPEGAEFWSTLSRLFKNRNYLMLWMAQNLLIGQLLSVYSSLNALYMIHFENGEKDVGVLGLTITLSGLVSAVLNSRILDKTKRFKAMIVYLYAGSIFSIAMIAISFYLETRWVVFVAIGLYGFFAFGYHPISCEVSVEISYPISENFNIAVLMLGNQIFAASMITITDKLLLYYSDVVVYIFLIVILLIGFVLTLLTKDVRMRQNAGNDASLTKTNEKC